MLGGDKRITNITVKASFKKYFKLERIVLYEIS